MRSYLPLFIRVAVAALLISYGVEKFQDPVNFLKSIHEYDILPVQPSWMLNLGPNVIPILELAAGLCILFGFLRRGAAVFMGGFLVLFTGAILWRTLGVMDETGQAFSEIAFDCGCGGGEVVIWEKMVLNAALIVGTFYCMFERGVVSMQVAKDSAGDSANHGD
ncbi:MAG: DoxX family protein [Planctomycetes bacterium]|nr:DoxX family protein [Planctomycetota bacterium]MCP4770643.1 DoxX family protein [Planctomycetota bacterium]MCP4861030.1 DoxX family protein [Planctomycetota bacterium]